MNFVSNVRKSFEWINSNSTKDYINISSNNHLPYHEVTGYFIPTLLNYGFREKAISFAEYLISIQRQDGSWIHSEDNKAYIFDNSQIIDGISEFGKKYDDNIKKSCNWLLSKFVNGKFIDDYNGSIGEHIYPRVVYCLYKCGIKNNEMFKKYIEKDDYLFDTLSHFYGYAFEGVARLNGNCNIFLNQVSQYNGLIPERNGNKSYCFVGLSQIALSLFLIGKFDMGMNVLNFVTKFQKENGGFNGSNGSYFPNDEISWAVKFYLDAFYEGQKLWFKNNINIFSSNFEDGDKDQRYVFIKNNIGDNDKVLEVGCGKGRYINRLNCDRYACDIADASKYINGKFSIGSCLRLPYDDNSFDVVFSSEVLEHSIFPDNAVKELIRVARPGGKVLIIDKDKKVKFTELHFGEEWLDFNSMTNKYDAVIGEIHQSSLAYPFYTAKIIKK